MGLLPWEEVVRHRCLLRLATPFRKNDVIYLHPLKEVLKDTAVMADVDVAEMGGGAYQRLPL
jgi:hypothetical protein